jgi:hypothetical protein
MCIVAPASRRQLCGFILGPKFAGETPALRKRNAPRLGLRVVKSSQQSLKDKKVPVIEVSTSSKQAATSSQTAKRTGRRPMIRFWKALGLVIFCAAFAYGAGDATISGVVKDPAGAPFRGAFVHAQNVQSKITVNVMSDSQGRYRMQNLPPGDYQVRVTAAGYAADPRTGVKLAAGDTSSLDFSLQQGTVRWADLSLYQGKALLPAGKGKDILNGNCFACHGFNPAWPR